MNYKQSFIKYFNIAQDDKPLCEYCGDVMVDVHHIFNKGMGGSKKRDSIQNLIGLCRECHTKSHDEKLSKSTLLECHFDNLKLSDRFVLFDGKRFSIESFNGDFINIYRDKELNTVHISQIKFQ